jgi:YidC/Oxa1 family membrane protein insertase
MNDIRRTILWVIFGFSMVMLWDQWQVASGNKPTFFPPPPKATSPAAPGADAASAAKGLDSLPAAGTAAAPASAIAGPAAAPAGGVSVAQSSARAPVVVSTDVLKLSFDTEGGSLIRAEMLKHRDVEDSKSNMVLLDLSKDRVYLAQTGFVGGSGLPNHKTPMTLVSSEKTLADGADTLQVRFESDEVGGAKLVKTYTLKRDAYDIAVTHELRNTSGAPLTAQLYLQLVRDGNKPAGESAFYQTFTGPVVFSSEKKYQKIDFSDIEKGNADHVKQAADGYVGMAQHYFASAWLQPSGARDIFTRKLDANLYAVGTVGALQTIAPGAAQTLTSTLFVGPQEENKLEALYPGLELLKDYGMFTVLAKPLFWLLDKLHSGVELGGFKLPGLMNWGWAIVALVVLLKIAFYWLNAKAYASMAKMKAINPKVMEMRERLKDKPQQMQQEMMKIYREEKVNPMGGCFPILVQIPVFISLYWVLLSTVEMRGAPWILWIQDLSSKDPLYILPVLMTATTLLQTALNPAPPDPMQAKLMWIMPLIFSVMFFVFPAGLVLYWITNNVLSIAQQWIINTRMGVPPQFNLPKFS